MQLFSVDATMFSKKISKAHRPELIFHTMKYLDQTSVLLSVQQTWTVSHYFNEVPINRGSLITMYRKRAIMTQIRF